METHTQASLRRLAEINFLSVGLFVTRGFVIYFKPVNLYRMVSIFLGSFRSLCMRRDMMCFMVEQRKYYKFHFICPVIPQNL
jgi:hypothetical protein